MKITAISLIALVLMPSIAAANCSGEKLEETAASCIPGTTWDAEKGSCIANPAS